MNTSLRKAALTLHSLSQEDRAWMLERLPESIKQALEPLISELNQLGFDTDELPEFDAAFDPISMALSNSIIESTDTDNAIARIENCPMPLLVSWINEEAEWVVAQVLKQRAWSWADVCLQQIDMDKRSRLSRMCQEIQEVPPMLGARLVKRLAVHLESKPLVASDLDRFHTVNPVRKNFVSEVKQWLRSFIRHG